MVVAIGLLSDLPSLLAGKPLGDLAGPDLGVAVSFAGGLVFARARRYGQAQERRAVRLEAERLVSAERAAAEERARIARELHDVVSHDVSLMVLQASVERRLLGEDGSTTAQTLTSIEATGREALGELRRMLGVLRHDGDSAPLQPQPGLALLPALLEQARGAGVDVALELEGSQPALSPGLDVAAYRIIQECLTNIAKHATGSRATVTLRYADDALDIEVVDEGPFAQQAGAAPSPLPSGGHGLAGMRERVALYGGTVEAGHRPGGGFGVRARVPVSTT